MDLLLNLFWSADAPTMATVGLVILASASQIRFLHLFILYQMFRRVFQYNFSSLQHIPTLRDVQRNVCVLLDQQNRRPLTIDLADDVEDSCHDHGCKAK